MPKLMIYNAAGCHCTSEEELLELYKSPHTGAVVTKSCTLKARVGNPHPRYYVQRDENGKLELSTNSTGLANYGVDYYLGVAEKIYAERMTPGSDLYEINKPFIISVAGLSFDENLEIIRKINAHNEEKNGVDAVELNLSCPNIPGKPQTGYSPEVVDQMLYKIFNDFKPRDLAFGLKLPPYLDRIHIKEIAEIVSKYEINFITCCNSIGNGLVFNKEGKRAIKPNEGLGGIGGPLIKPIALSNVYQFSQLLDDSGINVIGCGGIQTGQDICEHLKAGASAVQVGTVLYEEGPKCFERLSKEFFEIVDLES